LDYFCRLGRLQGHSISELISLFDILLEKLLLKAQMFKKYSAVEKLEIDYIVDWLKWKIYKFPYSKPRNTEDVNHLIRCRRVISQQCN
uniref:Uncharacterized protein n=1 Tax=Romanomermis culicivorax TaxID=13658 RepID=A0A915IIA7_ROMCU